MQCVWVYALYGSEFLAACPASRASIARAFPLVNAKCSDCRDMRRCKEHAKLETTITYRDNFQICSVALAAKYGINPIPVDN